TTSSPLSIRRKPRRSSGRWRATRSCPGSTTTRKRRRSRTSPTRNVCWHSRRRTGSTRSRCGRSSATTAAARAARTRTPAPASCRTPGTSATSGSRSQADSRRSVIDPLERWREHGEKPDYAGLLTFGTLPYTEDPADLEGVDVAVIGAPTAKRYVQIGLRGYWPGKAEFAWQRERGITSFFMHDVRDLGIQEVVRRTLDTVPVGPVCLSVDVDVLDPGFAPGTGTPEPGGMTTVDLLWACRAIAAGVELAGADVVEARPTAVGSLGPTALAAERTVREIMTGIA